MTGSLAVRWNHGTGSRRDVAEPLIQVHAYDEHTFVLRQSKSVSYEPPSSRATVDELLDAWLRVHPRPGYGLVVAHTHGHGDHVATDAQFADRPATTVVARELEAVREREIAAAADEMIVAALKRGPGRNGHAGGADG
ncbi:hypothetical protein AB0436_03975 [Streptomyces sp. NPDC051322]|uniref:hypothetical protein n=1 Tax=Streptomyces sp. NPDC051322 TaxID=3154645 RepID=UPI00344B6BEE